jgi:hypothetical protein
MTIKSFYLVGLSKDVYHQDIHIDQYHDFEALQVAIAEQYNIIQPAGEQQLHRKYLFIFTHLHLHQALGCKMLKELTCQT